MEEEDYNALPEEVTTPENFIYWDKNDGDE